MDEDDILYQSIIADPEQVSPDVDISGLRTETETNPELLAAVSEFPGLKFDSTSYDQYSDLMDLYSKGLPMVETPATDTITTPVVETPITDTSAGDQATRDLTTDLITDPINTVAQQNLIDQGIGVQGAIGDPVVAPGEAPVTQQQIDEFNFPALTQDSTAEDISQDLANHQVMLNPTGGNIIDEVALTGGDTGILDSVSGALSGVSTAARNAFEAVKDGTSTAVQFISDYGYPAYQALQGNLVAAGAAILNPLTLGLGFAGKIFESVGDTKSKQEYDSYTSEQQSEIDKAYAPGGVMEGYNAVSQFGKGVSGTVQDRIDKLEEVIANPNRDTSNVYTIDKDGNKIFTPSFNSAEKQLAELKNLQDKGGLTKRPTQDEIYDRDDIDPADVGLIAAGSADIQDFADIMPDELPNVTDPVEDFEVSGDIAPDGSAQVLDTAFGSVPSPNPAIADAALSGSFYVDDSSSDDSAPTGVDAGTADVQDYADIAPEPSPSGDSGSSGGGGKIVCTMMNETYGFGSFRNKIWLRQSKDLAPEYQKGYHKLFLPLVKLSKTNIVIRKILEHIAVHRTMDIRQEARGKTHILGRVYRKVLEPICYLVGKYAKR